MTEQAALDTRALENSAAALAAITSHERLCEQRYSLLSQWMQDSIMDRRRLHDDLRTGMNAIQTTLLRIALSALGGLLLVVAYFIDKFGLPGH